jgi:membrane fusion protein (multidrug efflux system)
MLSAVLMLGGCGDDAPGGPAGGWGGGGGRPATLVVTRPAEVRSIADVVEAIGTAQANESVTITAKVTDAIRQVRFDDGDLARAGDVLVELTNAEQTAQLAEAEAAVRDAQAQYERLEDLLGQGSVPVSDVDEARARLSGAVARNQAVVARLDDRLIQAPFTGLLGFRQVSAGTLITPGTAITTLDDVSIIKLDFAIAEVYLGVVQPGLELTAESAAFPGREFAAEVRTIGSRVNPVTRAVPVRAHIENPDALLRPGMLMTVRLATSSRDALMVPETALQQRGGQTFVYTVAEGKAVMTAVDLGIRRGGWAEIRSGLVAGQEVVAEGVLKMRNGVPVRTADGPPGGPREG